VLPLLGLNNANGHTEIFGYLCESRH
jgi:hypothetical protein